MKNPTICIKTDFSDCVTLCAGSVYPSTGRYDSTGDYWKLKKDGTLVYDGQKNLVDENGQVLKTADPTKSNSENFSDWFGMSTDSAMSMLGPAWNDNTKKYDPNVSIALNQGQQDFFSKVLGTNQGFFSGIQQGWKTATSSTSNFIGNASKWVSEKWNGLTGKDTPTAEFKAIEKKFKEVEGLPYAHDFKNQQILDENDIITKQSTGMNCIGLVSYLFGFNAKNSVRNFENYSEFDKLNRIKKFDDLQLGDVIRFRAGASDDHVSIWAGNGKVIESVSSPRKPGVRIDDLWRMTNYYTKTYGKNYEIDYFRYKK